MAYAEKSPRCAVLDCVEDPSTWRHLFPKQYKPYGKQWLEAVKNPVINAMSYKQVKRNEYYVCRRHFESSCYDVSEKGGKVYKRLKKSAVPTLFLASTDENNNNDGTDKSRLKFSSERKRFQQKRYSQMEVTPDLVSAETKFAGIRDIKAEVQTEDLLFPDIDEVEAAAAQRSTLVGKNGYNPSQDTMNKEWLLNLKRSGKIYRDSYQLIRSEVPDNLQSSDELSKRVTNLTSCPKEYLDIILAQRELLLNQRRYLVKQNDEIRALRTLIISAGLDNGKQAKIMKSRVKILKASSLFCEDFCDN